MTNRSDVARKTAGLKALLPWRQWREAHGGKVFETDDQFAWFMRAHPEVRKLDGWYDLPKGGFIDHGRFEPHLLQLLRHLAR